MVPMPCLICSSQICEEDQYYLLNNMGPEIIAIVESSLGHEVDEKGSMCRDCFANIMQTMSMHASVKIKEELPSEDTCNTTVCIWCQRSLLTRRSHCLHDGQERRVISERIAPRLIPEGSLVCHGCWARITRILRQHGIEPSPKTADSHTINTNNCIWCLRSLSYTRRKNIPADGPERNEIITQIYPREIPSGSCVCYSCWVAARRNVKKAEKISESLQDSVSAQTRLNNICNLCEMSLFRRQTHILPKYGPERDLVTRRVYPRELSEHSLLCTNCWAKIQDNLNVQRENVKDDFISRSSLVQLNEFVHTPSSSSRCFVPLCTNSERLRVPDFIRKRILVTQKVFVTEHSRICNEHRSLFDWNFLNQHHFSNTFTTNEIESMMRLCMQEISHYID